ncbi:hypothetical protein BU23DRAFT_599458 [Bimuria novae-zelandiae CBS 107.79]|uniref:Uncharacterized protein n=1 Tax=Bimuria novae-zelandiae CBS 107.79 TaxID=1447943 RepID=A0A6A5VCD6_9PLEO|nr:hypothetical protein BU23DRAFT_599458 [Bimuria novae-zelandiae CBS 107.79]
MNKPQFAMEETKKEQPPKSKQPEIPAMRRSRLSAHNLRIHTAACPKQPYFFNPIREARPEYEIDDDDERTPASTLGFSYDGLSPQDIDMKARRKASMDTLKLYSGNLASLSTPMDRLIAKQARRPPRIMVIIPREADTLDVSEVVSEQGSEDTRPDDQISVGSLRPSSDTLSVSREQSIESRKEKKEQGTRNWRRQRMRRRNTTEKLKALRRT